METNSIKARFKAWLLFLFRKIWLGVLDKHYIIMKAIDLSEDTKEVDKPIKYKSERGGGCLKGCKAIKLYQELSFGGF